MIYIIVPLLSVQSQNVFVHISSDWSWPTAHNDDFRCSWLVWNLLGLVIHKSVECWISVVQWIRDGYEWVRACPLSISPLGESAVWKYLQLPDRRVDAKWNARGMQLMSNINITTPPLKEFLISPETEKNNNTFTKVLKYNMNGIAVHDSNQHFFGACKLLCWMF